MTITITGRLERPAVTSRPLDAPLVSTPTSSTPSARPTVSRAARMLALAYLVEQSIDAGRVKDYTHAARLLGVTRARMTQVMNLLLLPLAEQEDLLLGRAPTTERELRRRATNATRPS